MPQKPKKKSWKKKKLLHKIKEKPKQVQSSGLRNQEGN